MDIEYRGCGPVVSRDIVGDEYAYWQPGEIKSVERGQLIGLRIRELGPGGEPSSRIERRPAADVIFASGPSWVDAKTGRNPLYVCADCGETTTAETFERGAAIAYRSAEGERQCVACFLREHPEHIEHHQRRGFDVAALDEPVAISAPPVIIASPDAPTGKPSDKPAKPDVAE